MRSALNPLLILCLLVVPLVVARRGLGSSWRWMGAGILSWVLGVSVKYGVHAGVRAARFGALPAVVQAPVWGLVSAATELGAAALFLRKARLSLGSVLGFGIAIGTFEALWVLASGIIQAGRRPPGPPTPGPMPGLIAYSFVLERVLALVAHTASRTLLYIGIRAAWPPAIATAVVGFAMIDGAAYYGRLAHWNWQDPAVLGRYLLFGAAVCVAEVAAAWLWAARAFGVSGS